MQEVINIGISGADCVEKKEEIKAAAKAAGKPSVAAFMLWLYEEWKKRQARKQK